MYWPNYYASYPYARTAADEGKYSTNYLVGKIGKTIRVILNYSSGSTINQNVQYEGILKEVGNDYIVVSVQTHGVKGVAKQENEKDDVFIYTVNLARAHFPYSAAENGHNPIAIPVPISTPEKSSKVASAAGRSTKKRIR